MEQRVKYPRTYHLPWSEGVSRDDLVLNSVENFVDKEVIVTEKMDGENTTCYCDGFHARSMDSGMHPSRNWLAREHSAFRFDIPKDMRVCGENVYAKHSIAYSNLPSYFMVFAIYMEDHCLSWKETEEWCELLELVHVPVLYRGVWNEEAVKSCFTGISRVGGEQEGYVVRLASRFYSFEFPQSVAKFVREGHVQTEQHWMYTAIEANNLSIG